MDDVAFTKVRLEHEGDPNRRRWNLVIPIVGFIVSVLAGGMYVTGLLCWMTYQIGKE